MKKQPVPEFQKKGEDTAFIYTCIAEDLYAHDTTEQKRQWICVFPFPKCTRAYPDDIG